MSGGSHNYLCYAGIPDILSRTSDMESIEQYRSAGEGKKSE